MLLRDIRFQYCKAGNEQRMFVKVRDGDVEVTAKMTSREVEVASYPSAQDANKILAAAFRYKVALSSPECRVPCVVSVTNLCRERLSLKR